MQLGMDSAIHVWPRSAPTNNTAPEPCRGPFCDTLTQPYRVARSVGSVGVTLSIRLAGGLASKERQYSIPDTASHTNLFLVASACEKLTRRKAEQCYSTTSRKPASNCEDGLTVSLPCLSTINLPTNPCAVWGDVEFRFIRAYLPAVCEHLHWKKETLLIDCCNLQEYPMQ